MRSRPLSALTVAVATIVAMLLPVAAYAVEVRSDVRLADPTDGKAREGVAAPASIAAYSDEPCEDGHAGPFPCENVDLLSFVPLAEMGGTNGNDLWGWTDPETGNEYAIMGLGYGTGIVDITEPTDPVVVGHIPSNSARYIPLWRDIKVYDDHAFIVSEHDGHGMQVFDLTRLRGHSGPPQVLLPDTTYRGGPDGESLSYSHNVAINTDTGYAYVVGSNTCDGGLHMVDINDPTQPTFAGCYSEDGYTHDVQCVVYDGQDGRFKGDEICFASNEDTLTIVDVTDKSDPVMLSRTGYETASYTHQGWLTEDHRWFLFGDETDEGSTVERTTTYIADVSRLTDVSIVPYTHDTTAIDHNLYIEDGVVHQANYTAGLRILDVDERSLRAGQLDEVAYFDVFPAGDPTEYAGAWSVYPFFESGTVIVSGIESGLFVLEPNLPSDAPGRSGERPDGRPTRF